MLRFQHHYFVMVKRRMWSNVNRKIQKITCEIVLLYKAV